MGEKFMLGSIRARNYMTDIWSDILFLGFTLTFISLDIYCTLIAMKQIY